MTAPAGGSLALYLDGYGAATGGATLHGMRLHAHHFVPGLWLIDANSNWNSWLRDNPLDGWILAHGANCANRERNHFGYGGIHQAHKVLLAKGLRNLAY